MWYKMRTVKKPRKQHTCLFCGGAITGEHAYAVGEQGGEFYTTRRHWPCEKTVAANCGVCDGNGRCWSDPDECDRERFREALDLCEICREKPTVELSYSDGLQVALTCDCRHAVPNGFGAWNSIEAAEKEWNAAQYQRRLDRAAANAGGEFRRDSDVNSTALLTDSESGDK